MRAQIRTPLPRRTVLRTLLLKTVAGAWGLCFHPSASVLLRSADWVSFVFGLGWMEVTQAACPRGHPFSAIRAISGQVKHQHAMLRMGTPGRTVQ